MDLTLFLLVTDLFPQADKMRYYMYIVINFENKI